MSNNAVSLLDQAISACHSGIELYGTHWRETYSQPLATNSPRGDFTSKIEKHYGPSGNWSSDLETRISMRAILYVSAAREHMQGLERLLVGHPYGLSTGPVARSVLEASGRCMWLLSHQLNLNTHTRPRVARLCLDEEDDARRYAELVKKTGRPNDIREAVRNHEATKIHLRPNAKGLFFDSEIVVSNDASKRLVSLCGESMPTLTELALLSLSPNNIPDRNAEFIYTLLSAMTHSKFFAMLETIDQPDDSARWLWPLREDNVFSARLVSITLASFINSWTTLSGWLEKFAPELSELESIHRELNRSIDEHMSGGD